MMLNSKWTKLDYLLDGTGILLGNSFGSGIVLSILWVIGLVGLASKIIPEIQYVLTPFSTLSEPIILIILLALVPLEIIFNLSNIASRLSNIHHANPEMRIHFYLMWTIMTIGFGLIFGTLGLFADAATSLSGYLTVVGASLFFSNICGIVARGYIRESPIAEFFVSRIVSKVPQLGYFW